MILYLDTSALVKLYAEEPGSDEVRNAVEEAGAVAVSEVGYLETRSALARKERERFFSTEEHDVAVESLKRDFREVYLAPPVTGEMIARAGELVHQHALRAYDAIHLATALALREEAGELAAREPAEESPQESDELQVLLMTYDSSLTEAAHQEGLAYEPGHDDHDLPASEDEGR